jgi:invasion protein IalB
MGMSTLNMSASRISETIQASTLDHETLRQLSNARQELSRLQSDYKQWAKKPKAKTIKRNCAIQVGTIHKKKNQKVLIE